MYRRRCNWLAVVSACSRAFGESAKTVSRIQSSIKREAKDHLSQAIGCGQSAILKSDLPLTPDDPKWKEKVASFLYAATLKQLSDPDKVKSFWKNWNDKALRQECSIPEEAVSDLLPSVVTGAGVTHYSPMQEIVRALVSSSVASGPAPSNLQTQRV